MNATVRSSFRNRLWQVPEFTSMDVDALIAGGANALTAPILAARNMPPEDVTKFLIPTFRDLMPDPAFFKDMNAAADRMVQAIVNKERIAIWSDYDVDGATSAGVLGTFLRDCGATNFSIYIPDRITEGYGPNTDGLLALQKDGADLVIILDAGTAAYEPLEAARDANLDVVVIDHHAAEAELPPAVALVNPNRLDQEGGFNHVCAAGMTWISVVAVNLRLRKMGYFDGKNGRPDAVPDLMSYLDLVALGTICDVVPLTGINRAFVMRGLPVLSMRKRPGIKALAAVAGCADEINASACGFALGPRINAGGRIGDSGAGAALLLCQDADEAQAMAEMLNDLNTERQSMEKACTAQALEQVVGNFVPGETRKLATAVVDAHEGIVGISAARVKEALDAPAFVLAHTPEGWLKGSGRSVTGFDLGSAVIKSRHQGLLVKGGGHAMAGGITLEPEKLEAFIEFMNREIEESEYYQVGVISRIDAVVSIDRATTGLVEAVQSLAPFGTGNPMPRFMLSRVLMSQVGILKDKHIKCTFEDPKLQQAGKTVTGLIWGAKDTPFGDRLLKARGKLVDVLGSLEINEWKTRKSIQIMIDDVRISS